MNNLVSYIDELFSKDLLRNIAIKVGKKDDILLEYYKSDGEINADTLFDMASVSKMLCTTTLSLIALDKGLISLDDKVTKYFDVPEKGITIKNLLSHTIGIGHKSLNLPQMNIDNVAEYILNIPSDIPVGSDVLYSCPGFIVMGKILEKVFDDRLDRVFETYVTKPLGMDKTCYLPLRQSNMVNANIDEKDKGRVNDYNCQFLGGVAGNAGVFSNITDLTKYVKMLISGGEPLFSKDILNIAAENHTAEMKESRGLGFVYSDEKYPRTGDLMPKGSIGHGGWTGQSVFVDLKSGLYVIILTDLTVSTQKKFGSPDSDLSKEIIKNIHFKITSDLF